MERDLRHTADDLTPHSRGGLPIGPSFSLNGQTTQASEPEVASQWPSCDQESERDLPG